MSNDYVRPGEDSHSDQPNWRPGESVDEYLLNCREGLEQCTDKRFASLLGWTRKQVWQAKVLGAIPEELFERLLEDDRAPSKVPSITEFVRSGYCCQLAARSKKLNDAHTAVK